MVITQLTRTVSLKLILQLERGSSLLNRIYMVAHLIGIFTAWDGNEQAQQYALSGLMLLPFTSSKNARNKRNINKMTVQVDLMKTFLKKKIQGNIDRVADNNVY